MSDWNPGAGHGANDSGGTYEPADESAASVFGRAAPPGGSGRVPPGGPTPYDAPAQPPMPPPQPGGGRPPGPPSGYDRPTQVYGQPPGQQARPGQPRPPGARPSDRGDRGDRGDRPGRGDRGTSPARRGPGLPVGLGALVGVAGLACFLAALFVLPWFTVAGQDVTLSDLRSAATADESPEAGASGDPDDALPDVADGVPSPDEVTEAVEQEARAAASRAVTAAVDSSRARYLELYTGPVALVVSGAVALAVLFSTILSPRSTVASMLLGFRRISGVVTVLAAGAHGAALWVVFTGDGAPSPTPGVWLGVGGLAAVLLGCIVGPKK